MSGSQEKKNSSRASQGLRISRVVFNSIAEELVRDAASGQLKFRKLTLDPPQRLSTSRGHSRSRSMPNLRSSAPEVVLPPQFSSQSNHPSIGAGTLPSVASRASSILSTLPSVYPMLQREDGQTGLRDTRESWTGGIDTVATGSGLDNPPGRKSFTGRKSAANLPRPGDVDEDEDPYAPEIPLAPAPEILNIGNQAGRVPSLKEFLKELNAGFEITRGNLDGVTNTLERFLATRQHLFPDDATNPCRRVAKNNGPTSK